MWRSTRWLAATAVAAAGIVSLAGAASALPGAGGLALKNAAPSNVESRALGRPRLRTGRIRGRRHIGRRSAGAALLRPAVLWVLWPRALLYAPGPYYVDPGYVDPGPYSADPTGGDPVTYCLQRFRSYDPRSGTYLGYDGYRHPCP